MFKNLDLFKMAHAMAVHAGTRQALISQNVANADTPGYAARDLLPFAQTYRDAGGGPGLRATRGAHLTGQADIPMLLVETRATTADMNENTVSVEDQMLNAVGAKRQHDRALAIYKSSLSILRTSIRTN
ncbi:MAG: FlgB family protein [Rhodobacteraceae bacterium]|nr:FlgB family protein [Paracoccaceae bacterium]